MARGFEGTHELLDFIHGSAIEVVVVASLPGGLQAVDVLDHGLLIEEHVSGKSSGDCKCEDDGLHVGYYIKFNREHPHLYFI